MAEPAVPLPMTLEEFLAWEESQELRYESVNAAVRAMTGGTLEHNAIADNAFTALRLRLQGKPCRPWRADTKVISPSGDVMYPDVVVNCSPRGRRGRTSIDDPVLVVEVASPSTEKYDATAKRWAYQSIASLRHLVLLAQDEARAEVASRNADGTWTSRFVEGLEGALDLPALELSLPMRDLYEDVEPEPALAQNV